MSPGLLTAQTERPEPGSQLLELPSWLRSDHELDRCDRKERDRQGRLVNYQPLREVRTGNSEDMEEIVWFHDANFAVDEITFDKTAATVEIVFDQDVRHLPSDLPLPQLRQQRRRWFGSSALVPFVECRLRVRHARQFSLQGDEMTWGVLNRPLFDQRRRILTIEAVFGPNIEIGVDAFDVAVSMSSLVRFYKPLRTFLLGESLGERMPVTEACE
jgi:hypothetical protein